MVVDRTASRGQLGSSIETGMVHPKTSVIERVWCRTERLYMKKPLKIANEHYSYCDTVVIFVKSGKFIGIGEAAPDHEVTGETIASVKSFINDADITLTGKSCSDILAINKLFEENAKANQSAMAGLDIALYDLNGKIHGKSVLSMLGGDRVSEPISITIGIENMKSTLNDAIKYRNSGFKTIKIKVGLEMLEDVKKVAKIRKAIGPTIRLVIDANQGYTVDESMRFLDGIKDYDIFAFEQPVAYTDIDGMVYLKKNSKIPIMADESVKDIQDLKNIIRKGAADMINIKLMKMGGITRSMEVYRLAYDNGIKSMVGCMEESKIGIAAGTTFAISINNIGFSDLDSHLSHSNRLVRSGISTKNGENFITKGKGLGIRLTKNLAQSTAPE